MSHLISVHGVDYLPVVVLPYITHQFLATPVIVDMLASPDSYCDIDNDAMLAAYRIGSSGQLNNIPYQCFSCPCSVLPADAVVLASSAKSLFDTLVSGLSRAGKLDNEFPSWDLSAALPMDVAQNIANKISHVVKRNLLRVNGRPVKLQKMRLALAEIERVAKAKNVQFSAKKLPGFKRHLLAIIKVIDASITIRGSSFDWYAKTLGLGWVQGSKPSEARALLNLFGLQAK